MIVTYLNDGYDMVVRDVIVVKCFGAHTHLYMWAWIFFFPVDFCCCWWCCCCGRFFLMCRLSFGNTSWLAMNSIHKYILWHTKWNGPGDITCCVVSEWGCNLASLMIVKYRMGWCAVGTKCLWDKISGNVFVTYEVHCVYIWYKLTTEYYCRTISLL